MDFLTKFMVFFSIALLVLAVILFVRTTKTDIVEPSIRVSILETNETVPSELIYHRVNYGSVDNLQDVSGFYNEEVLIKSYYNSNSYIFAFNFPNQSRVNIAINLDYFNETFEDIFNLYPYIPNGVADNYPNTKDILHYNSSNLSYSFDKGCSSLMIKNIRLSFDMISNSTNSTLQFFEDKQSSTNIKIKCLSSNSVDSEEQTIGEGRPEKIYNNTILNSYVYLYDLNDRYSDSCFDFPATEIHEILHTFGLAHYNSTKDIMYWQENSVSCQSMNGINDKYGICLASIYDEDISVDCEDVNFLEIQ